jgi:hypothetical protein
MNGRTIRLTLVLLAGGMVAAATQCMAVGCEAEISDGDIVYFGDSISVQPYGAEIAKTLRAAQPEAAVARFAVAGSAAVHWIRGFHANFFKHRMTVCESRKGMASPAVPGKTMPLLQAILANGKPGAVVFALGTNDLNNYCGSVKQGGDRAGMMWINSARELAKAAKDSAGKCVWVLPLTYNEGPPAELCKAAGGWKTVISKLKTAVGDSCATINTSEFCEMPALDSMGIHPKGDAEAIKLGACVGRKITEALK